MQEVFSVLDDVIFRLKLERFEGESPLSLVAQKLNTHPKQVLRGIVGGIALVALLVTLFFAHHTLFLALSVAYPAFQTVRAAAHDDLFSKDGKLWLSYWTVFGIFTVVEFFFGFILHHLPFFNLAKTFFIIWLYNRKTRGAETINNSFLQHYARRFGNTEQSAPTQVRAETPKTE